MYAKCKPVWITAELKQGSSCTYSRTRDLHRVKSGARNTAHLQLTIKTQQFGFEKLYIDLIHSMKNNIRKVNRHNTICPNHKNGSMSFPFQGAFCASHSSRSIKKITIEESNDKIRLKIKKDALKSKNGTSKICVNISFSCNRECAQLKKSSSTILTRAYIYNQSEKRRRQLSNTSLPVQIIPDKTIQTKIGQTIHNLETGNQSKQARNKHRAN